MQCKFFKSVKSSHSFNFIHCVSTIPSWHMHDAVNNHQVGEKFCFLDWTVIGRMWLWPQLANFEATPLKSITYENQITGLRAIRISCRNGSWNSHSRYESSKTKAKFCGKGLWGSFPICSNYWDAHWSPCYDWEDERSQQPLLLPAP